MSGLLQYNFFPTDFFYPRPQPVVNSDSSNPCNSVVPVQTRPRKSEEHRVDAKKRPNVTVRYDYNMDEHHNKFWQTSCSTELLLAPAVITKKSLND
ncbi:hypothetical protein ACFX13_041624 [Malus domestica]